MGQVNINIRMDEDLKKQFEAFCNDIGLNMSSAFNVFAKTTVRQQRIPFEISTDKDPFYSFQNQQRLVKAANRMENTGGTVHELIEVSND